MSSQLYTSAALFALLVALGCSSQPSNTADNCASVSLPTSLPKACAACVAANCCSAAKVCAANSDCGPLTDCAFGCQPDDAACNQACADLYPTGLDDYGLVSNCAQANCPDTCIPGNAGPGGTGGAGSIGGASGRGTGGVANAAGGSTGVSGSSSTGGAVGIGGSSNAAATCAIESQTCADCLQAQCTSENQACQTNATCKADFDTAKSCSCNAQKVQNAFGVQLCFDTFYTTDRSNFIACTKQLCMACGVP